MPFASNMLSFRVLPFLKTDKGERLLLSNVVILSNNQCFTLFYLNTFFTLFHVEQFGFYLPNSTSKMLMSLGEMPGIRLACARVSGSIFVSF